MTVKELKELIKDLADDTDVLVAYEYKDGYSKVEEEEYVKSAEVLEFKSESLSDELYLKTY